MRVFPDYAKYVVSIFAGLHNENAPSIQMTFLTPPQHDRGGIPTVFLHHWQDGNSGPDFAHEFPLRQRDVAELRNWCERTLFALAHPERYEEKTSWRDWYPFNTPQRAGFTRYAFEVCDTCIEEELEREEEENGDGREA